MAVAAPQAIPAPEYDAETLSAHLFRHCQAAAQQAGVIEAQIQAEQAAEAVARAEARVEARVVVGAAAVVVDAVDAVAKVPAPSLRLTFLIVHHGTETMATAAALFKAVVAVDVAEASLLRSHPQVAKVRHAPSLVKPRRRLSRSRKRL